MSETSRTDESVPSLSSYPPAFITLITTFIKRAEEAETRAHKALVILRAKDQQVFQLQQRMEALEKIASRLEDVMVPPLDLPLSPLTPEPLDGPHCREEGAGVDRKDLNSPPLETLYERYPSMQQKQGVKESVYVHNCYTRCQHLIDGLERSNCQLREALTVESQQRVKDHEQYVSTLTAVTQAVKQLQSGQTFKKSQPECVVHQALKRGNTLKANLHDIVLSTGAAGDNIAENPKKPLENSEMALIDKTELKKTVDKAESIIKTLRFRMEGNINKSKPKDRRKLCKRVICYKTSRSSTSSYHTPYSSTVFKQKLQRQSSSSFLNALQIKNKKLKLKYAHVYENLKKSLSLCGKLQEDVISLTKNAVQKTVKNKNVDGCSQTDKADRFQLHNSPPTEKTEKPQASKSFNILHGRLEAAAKVMSKQAKQIQNLQQQLTNCNNIIDSLKKRLARAESAVAGKSLLEETTKRQLQELENRNSILNEEINEFKNTISVLKEELCSQVEITDRSNKDKEHSMMQFEDMKRTLEVKLNSLSSTLQQKDEMTKITTNEMEIKLTNLRKQFMAQAVEARDRLLAADDKIQELYYAIESFLRLLFSLNKISTPDLSPSSQAHAVQMASDILQIAPVQVKTILNSSRVDHVTNKWIKECKRLVHRKVFSNNLAQFLLDAVLESRL